jgi:hypothetical protein
VYRIGFWSAGWPLEPIKVTALIPSVVEALLDKMKFERVKYALKFRAPCLLAVMRAAMTFDGKLAMYSRLLIACCQKLW